MRLVGRVGRINTKKQKIIWPDKKGLKRLRPHMIVTFGEIIHEAHGTDGRPVIMGVNLALARFLGEHKDVQKWDFITWEGETALLVPLRYFILKLFRVSDIYLDLKG